MGWVKLVDKVILGLFIFGLIWLMSISGSDGQTKKQKCVNQSGKMVATIKNTECKKNKG